MKRKHFSLLLLIGCLLMILAAIGLYSGPNVTQFAFVPDNELKATIDAMNGVYEELPESTVTLHAVQHDCFVSTDYDTSVSDVMVYMVGIRWNEVYPQQLTYGRTLSYFELLNRVRSVVLDDDMAFKLYGAKDPIGEIVSINGEQFEIVGVAKHNRRIGESQPYAVWIPIGSDEVMKPDIAVVSALSNGDMGATKMFESTVEKVFKGGSLYQLSKERMRSIMILRLLLLIIFIRLLIIWVRKCLRILDKWQKDYKMRISQNYISRLIGFIILRAIGFILLIAVSLGLFWLLMKFAVQPVLVFTEWVPEILVSFGAIRSRFWELCAVAAQPVVCITPEMAEIRFFSSFMQWGVICAMAGFILLLIKRLKEKCNS